MQHLGTKKSLNLSGQQNITRNHANSWDKKLTQPLMTKRIKHPLGTKKITQPLGTKKIMQPLGTTKKSTTSGDQQKSCNLSGPEKSCNIFEQKNPATCQEKKCKLFPNWPNFLKSIFDFLLIRKFFLKIKC
jgi:hypothetical protein